MTTPKKKPVEKPEPAAVVVSAIVTEAQSKQHFPIVGIGASAGGLAAFEAFFSGMPADKEPDMAFVLVQHLAPDHKSILTELIRRYTRMQVSEVEDGTIKEVWLTAAALLNEAGEVYAIATTERARGVE